MKRILLDESGNTASDLLNKEQPLYILCSTDFNEEKTRRKNVIDFLAKQYYLQNINNITGSN